jgi:hypothetical protein
MTEQTPRDSETRALSVRIIDQAARAHRWAHRATAVSEGSRWSEPECVAASLIATATTTEDWILWAHLSSRVPVPHEIAPASGHTRIASTPRLWRNLPMIARANGQPVAASLDLWHLLFLADLDAWHQSLQHGCPAADADLWLRFARLGFARDTVDHHHVLLAAPLATSTLVATAHIFTWAHDITGLPVPDLTHPTRAASLEDPDLPGIEPDGPETDGVEPDSDLEVA